MENPPSDLSFELVEDLCRHYREAERLRALNFEFCEVRFTAQSPRDKTSGSETARQD
jgi:hypothetical protein